MSNIMDVSRIAKGIQAKADVAKTKAIITTAVTNPTSPPIDYIPAPAPAPYITPPAVIYGTRPNGTLWPIPPGERYVPKGWPDKTTDGRLIFYDRQSMYGKPTTAVLAGEIPTNAVIAPFDYGKVKIVSTVTELGEVKPVELPPDYSDPVVYAQVLKENIAQKEYELLVAQQVGLDPTGQLAAALEVDKALYAEFIAKKITPYTDVYSEEYIAAQNAPEVATARANKEEVDAKEAQREADYRDMTPEEYNAKYNVPAQQSQNWYYNEGKRGAEPEVITAKVPTGFTLSGSVRSFFKKSSRRKPKTYNFMD